MRAIIIACGDHFAGLYINANAQDSLSLSRRLTPRLAISCSCYSHPRA